MPAAPALADRGPTQQLNVKIKGLEKSITQLEKVGADVAPLKEQLATAKQERVLAIPPGHRLESVNARVEKARRAHEAARAHLLEAEVKVQRCAGDLAETEAELRQVETSLQRVAPSGPSSAPMPLPESLHGLLSTVAALGQCVGPQLPATLP